ncbi:OmpP1/FadL family transporter [Desulfobotulus mexicanus]|uniref:Long-chain fatty acid transporter n=1 Tax=Desulfobotulus mexicanus TaxID=2586642 RepID=A0A5Q4VIM9_9BACT|nr:outer membrane protein transport protein [Desulfobotulus mexicanus]TYT76010.1 long-chain fatty acid transporter [Desulfobotulus mexicanus]
MKKQILCLATALVLGAGTAYAGCVDTFGIGAKATSMGGAYGAYADDPFAVYYNAAGLTQIKRPTLAGGLHMIDPTIKMKDFYIEGSSNPDFPRSKNEAMSFSDSSENLYAPHVGFAMPLSERLFMGVAIYSPFGLEVEFPSDPKVNPTAYSSFHSYYFRKVINPGLAYKVNDKLSLGFGVSIGQTKSAAEKIYYVGAKDLTSEGTVPDMLRTLDGAHLKIELEDELNYSFNLGIQYKPVENLTLGLTYRSETDVDFEGDAYVNGIKVAKATLDYNHPQQIQAGIRYTPHDRFSMQMDLVWTEWSILKNQTEPITSIENSLGIDLVALGKKEISSPRNWENTRQLRFGGEYIMSDLVTLRAGYFYDPTPIPDDTLDTMWPDADKKTYSFGAGFNFEKFTIDTVLQYTAIEQTRIVGGESVNLNKVFAGEVSPDPTRVHAKAEGYLLGAGITVSYRF